MKSHQQWRRASISLSFKAQGDCSLSKLAMTSFSRIVSEWSQLNAWELAALVGCWPGPTFSTFKLWHNFYIEKTLSEMYFFFFFYSNNVSSYLIYSYITTKPYPREGNRLAKLLLFDHVKLDNFSGHVRLLQCTVLNKHHPNKHCPLGSEQLNIQRLPGLVVKIYLHPSDMGMEITARSVADTSQE